MNGINNGSLTIDTFLGLRLSLTGDTGLQLGELSYMKNIRITNDYKPRKREGYKEQFATLGAHRIQGQWSGYIGATFFHLFACNGHLYKLINGVNTDLGVLTDAPTNIFFFGSKVYIQNGSEYKSFDGTTLIDVVGYRPKIAIGTPPTGGGTPYEQLNLLNGLKHQTFNSDGIATVYTIAETNVASIDYVKVNGVTKTLVVDYTQNLVTGEITFLVAPIVGQDNVDIGWAKGAGTRALVYAHKFSILFGGVNDTRVHLYGDGTNTILFSELADGIPSAEYFPAFNTSSIGSSQYSVTSLLKQYDRLIINTEKGSYYSNYVFESSIVSFPVYPLNDNVGNIPLGQGQLIQNNPFVITDRVWEFVSSSVRDEKNVQDKSERVKVGLDTLNLANAITFDYEELSEYWLCVGKEVYIYNYSNDTWYYYELYDIPTCFTVIGGVLFMGTSTGQIMKWAQYVEQNKIPSYLTDNTHVINSRIETGFMDFGINYKRKFLNFAWVGMKPETKSRCFVEWESDYDTSTEAEPIYYSLMDFENVDFADFSFQVNANPQPFRLKLKSKKFTFFKLILSNDSLTETMTILSVNLPVIVGGFSK